MAKKSMQVCDVCDERESVTFCNVCGCDLCNKCNFGGEHSLIEIELMVYNGNFLYETFLERGIMDVCCDCSGIVKKHPFVIPESVIDELKRLFNEWKASLEISYKQMEKSGE